MKTTILACLVAASGIGFTGCHEGHYQGSVTVHDRPSYYGYGPRYTRRTVHVSHRPVYEYRGNRYYYGDGRYYYNRGSRRHYVRSLPRGGVYLRVP